MAENTEIAWCDSTFNPWIGCTKVGPGCDHCYAEADFDLRKHRAKWGPGNPRSRTSVANWKKPLQWNRQHEQFFAEQGRRRRVFCASLADVFDNEVPRQWRIDLFRLIIDTPNLDWLLLTKRIGNAAKMLQDTAECIGPMMDASDRYKPLPNVWLGATVVNQEEADRDIPKLLAIPARVRWLSMEPLLGPVEFRGYTLTERPCFVCKVEDDLGQLRGSMSHPINCGWRHDSERAGHPRYGAGIDWVVVGGESGPKARPMHPDWARSLRDQCAAAGVPFLFKQWGEWAPDDPGEGPVRELDCAGVLPNGGAAKYSEGYRAPFDTSERLEQANDVRLDGRTLMYRVGKKAAGRLLDGKQHDGYPEVRP
jgi:protein gp37